MPAPSPSPAPVRLTCPQCAAQVPCYDPEASCYFCCPTCYAWFAASPAADAPVPPVYLTGFKAPVGLKPAMPLGAVAELGGYRCRVTGYQVRCEQGDPLQWGEYQLRPAEEPGPARSLPADFPVQLVEAEGEWLLVRRAPAAPTALGNGYVASPSWRQPATSQEYEHWNRYAPAVRFAQGEFDWNILDDERLYLEEFVSTSGAEPYWLVREQGPDQPAAWYQSERLEARQVAEAFSLNLGVPTPPTARAATYAPEPTPVSPAQQLAINQSWLLLGVSWLLLLGIQLLMGLLHPPRQVAQESYLVQEASTGGTSQMLVSKPFTLVSATALEVAMTVGGLDNHWAEVAASLVNDQTGQAFEFGGLMENYYGYEDGESWREGNTATTVLLHDVPPGRYHFNFYPTVETGGGPVALDVQAEEHVPLWSNFWLATGLLGLLGLLQVSYSKHST